MFGYSKSFSPLKLMLNIRERSTGEKYRRGERREKRGERG